MNSGRVLLSMALTGLALAACAGPHQVLLQGDAKEAQVGYAGDLDGATAIARRHCAEYERVPHFVGVAEDVAYFDCVRPARP